MLKSLLILIAPTAVTIIVLMSALIIWSQTIPIDDPSEADGIGFLIVYGFIAAIPISLFIGLIVSTILMGSAKRKKLIWILKVK
ncbi:hypothetical protein [Mesobacillus zeae]|uniref:Uncharacterized protein n=1 Tax=Mesobacillus zeae TaxID=1917180 RepID=A0A398B2Z1_9BACI|nr:hypothetical protein [Mesobacillus zeae]RID82320.1 hypothetical protein D1970_19300 [Mesobacillus zeae]